MGHWRLNYGDLNLCIYKFKPKNIIYHLFRKYVYYFQYFYVFISLLYDNISIY